MSTKVKTLGNTKDKLIKLRTCNLAHGEKKLIFSLPEHRLTAVTASSVDSRASSTCSSMLMNLIAALAGEMSWVWDYNFKWCYQRYYQSFQSNSKSRLSSGGLKAKKIIPFGSSDFYLLNHAPHPEKETVSSWPYFQQNKKNLEVCWCKCNSKLS